MISKKTIISVIKSKDGKTLLSNFMWLSVLQVAGYVFPLITIPYLARVIGVAKFGEIAFAGAVIVYFQTIVDWGFTYTATRDVARNRENKQELSKILSNIMWCKILLLSVSAILLLLLTLFVNPLRSRASIIWMTFLLLPGAIMFPDWFFQGLERMKYTSILNLLSKFLFTVLIFIFIKEKTDYIYQPLFSSLGFALSGLSAMYIIINRWGITLQKPVWTDMMITLKGGSDVFINQLAPNLYGSFSVLLLGTFSGSVATGKLDGGTNFVNIAIRFLGTISRTIFPYLSRRGNKHVFFVKLTIGLSIVCAVVLFLGAPLIINIFYTSAFSDSIVVMQIMSVSIIFYSLSDMYGANYLVINGGEKILRNITLVTSLIGLLISFPLIYYFSYIGGAVIIVLTRAMLGLGSMYYAHKINRV